MLDTGHRSPHVTTSGVRGEVGERATGARAGLARSLHLTGDPWEQFAASYVPGSFGRDATSATVRRECNLLQRILAGALSMLDEGLVVPRPERDSR